MTLTAEVHKTIEAFIKKFDEQMSVINLLQKENEELKAAQTRFQSPCCATGDNRSSSLCRRGELDGGLK